MKTLIFLPLAAAAAIATLQDKDPDPRPFTDTFIVDEKDLASTGRNPFFILEPGYQLVLEDEEEPRRIPSVFQQPVSNRQIRASANH